MAHCSSCGGQYGDGESWACPHKKMDGFEGVAPPGQRSLMGPVDKLKTMIVDRGQDAANFWIYEHGTFLMVAPRIAGIEIELPDVVDGWLVRQGEMPA